MGRAAVVWNCCRCGVLFAMGLWTDRGIPPVDGREVMRNLWWLFVIGGCLYAWAVGTAQIGNDLAGWLGR